MDSAELQQQLFTGRTHVYALLDGASIDGLRNRLHEMRPPNYCLFPGELEPDVAETAPYLVGLIAGTPFSDWVLKEHFGKHWGIFAQSRQSMTEMRKHFRALVKVHTESGKSLIFRFYDPRVFRRFVPTCNAGELATFFGSVDAFFVEEANGSGMSRFVLENKTLKETKLN